MCIQVTVPIQVLPMIVLSRSTDLHSVHLIYPWAHHDSANGAFNLPLGTSRLYA